MIQARAYQIGLAISLLLHMVIVCFHDVRGMLFLEMTKAPKPPASKLVFDLETIKEEPPPPPKPPEPPPMPPIPEPRKPRKFVDMPVKEGERAPKETDLIGEKASVARDSEAEKKGEGAPKLDGKSESYGVAETPRSQGPFSPPSPGAKKAGEGAKAEEARTAAEQKTIKEAKSAEIQRPAPAALLPPLVPKPLTASKEVLPKEEPPKEAKSAREPERAREAEKKESPLKKLVEKAQALAKDVENETKTQAAKGAKAQMQGKPKGAETEVLVKGPAGEKPDIGPDGVLPRPGEPQGAEREAKNVERKGGGKESPERAAAPPTQERQETVAEKKVTEVAALAEPRPVEVPREALLQEKPKPQQRQKMSERMSAAMAQPFSPPPSSPQAKKDSRDSSAEEKGEASFNIKMDEYAKYYRHVSKQIGSTLDILYGGDISLISPKPAEEKIIVDFKILRTGEITDVKLVYDGGDYLLSSMIMSSVRGTSLDRFPKYIREEVLKIRYTFYFR